MIYEFDLKMVVVVVADGFGTIVDYDGILKNGERRDIEAFVAVVGEMLVVAVAA